MRQKRRSSASELPEAINEVKPFSGQTLQDSNLYFFWKTLAPKIP